MSLTNCPECGHEISTAAVACPGCGRPINTRPVAVPAAVVETKARNDRIPPWVIVPIVLLGVMVLFGMIYLFSTEDQPESNVALNVNTRRAQDVDRTGATTSSTIETTVPSTTVPTDTTSYPAYPSGSAYPSSPQTVPGTQVAVPQTDKATVLINAKISTRNGNQQAVRNTRFYLLDKDLEMVLSDAEIEPIEGQTLSTSLAIAIADQGRYGDFYRKAMQALRDHIKYAGTTDSNGRAQLGSVKPDSYYLFGVARSGEGFAFWNAPVSVTSGENLMNLAPQPITQMPSATGEE